MSQTLEPILVDVVANTNFKNLCEFPTLYFQSMMEDGRIIGKQMNENLVRGSARMNGALDSVTTRALKDVATIDMSEASAIVKMGTGVDPQSQGYLLAQSVSQLGAALSSIQEFIKAAILTPPITNIE